VHRYGVPGYMPAGAEQWSNSTGKACPGDRRIAQLPAVSARAQQLLGGAPIQEDDMPTPDDLFNAPLFTDNGEPVRFRNVLDDLRHAPAEILEFLQNTTGGDTRLIVDMLREQQQQLTGLQTAFGSLAEAYAAGRDDLTAEELTAAVDEGIRRGGAAIIAAQNAARAANPST
jgi:hypothetical protein